MRYAAIPPINEAQGNRTIVCIGHNKLSPGHLLPCTSESPASV